jgi:alpha-glucosidase
MTSATVDEVAALLTRPHHDGSESYVLERPDTLGAQAVVRVRVPRGTPVDDVVLRYLRDGEPRAVRAEVDEETATDTWWRAAFPAHNPATRYRWLLVDGDAWTWVNGLGPTARDVPDSDDFVLALGGGPDWHLGSVAYQVFPDRFASSGLAAEPPEWAVPRSWDEPPTGRGPATPREWFGGDLPGVEAHLDHVERLGASLLYLTPIFPAGSTHRYDATTFDRVDVLLGGDEALASLVAAAHAQGIRVVGDLTLNHCGRGHEWMAAALADPAAPERDFFYFDESLPAGYESWLGFASLPKLDWRSPELRRRMDQVVRKWLQPPFSLDGWRIDVANMVGRYRELDLTAEVARSVLRTVAGARPDALLVAEHGHDFRADLAGDGWHGAMNYSGFLKPVWTWLRTDEPAPEQRRSFWGLPVGVPRVGGVETVAAMRTFRAGVPWQSVLHSWTLLDSHDTARFRTVAGSRDRHIVGIGLQMTTPGVPMLFAGDELGLEGEWGEDARRTMPWTRTETWDGALLDEYRRLIALRRSSAALARGGIRYALVDDDAIVYLREAPGERLLCLASRAEHEPVRLALDTLACRELEVLYGGEAVAANGHAVLPAEGPSFHVWRLIDG